METDRGKTRGKFTELVFDVKHDAWVIPQYSHGILLLIDAVADSEGPALRVDFASPEVLALNFTNAPGNLDTSDNATFQLTWAMDGIGNYDSGVTFSLENVGSDVATDLITVSAAGLISTASDTGTGQATVRITSDANPDLSDTVLVTVVA